MSFGNPRCQHEFCWTSKPAEESEERTSKAYRRFIFDLLAAFLDRYCMVSVAESVRSQHSLASAVTNEDFLIHLRGLADGARV